MMTIDLDRLMGEVSLLAESTDVDGDGVTRVVFGPADLAVRAVLRDRCRDAELTVREDALGNLFARWLGHRPELPAVAVGSHTDAIPAAGRYDGVVGVLGALEAIRALRASGFRPERSIELVVFTSEEPTRFGLGCLGSRAMSGALPIHEIERLRDADGQDPGAVARAAGFTGALGDVRLASGHFAAFLELHIEQGPVLQASGAQIGVVSAIAAPATLHVEFLGSGGHAGTVLMRERHDALTAGAESALVIESAASTASSDTVATVGIFKVWPGAVNSIPSRVSMSIDVRDIALDRRDRVIADVERSIRAVCLRRGVDVRFDILNADPPATCDPRIVRTISEAAAELGHSSLSMVSRAYHDALFMSRLCPTGMIFVPSKDGVSHRPDEYTSPEDIGAGVRVLARTLGSLAAT